MPRCLAPLSLSALLAACTPAPGPTDPADFAFMGSWDCGVTVMTFLPDGYMPSNEDAPIAVAEFLRTANGATQITLANGNRMSLQNVTDQTMTWFSHQSGDSFDCTRVAG
ncbi:hypothetical protein [Paracoccus zhejiangensis]|nr:hypothetical protein [Paracoccus zhejiangensis]